MSQKTSFVLVPGAWHTASLCDKVTHILEERGHTCKSVTLPSTAGDPSATILDDIAAARASIQSEIMQGRNVIVVGHSYGGVVAVSSVKGLTNPSSEAPSSGRVVGTALIASGFATTGISFLDLFGGKPPPIWKLDEATGFLEIVVDVKHLFYHDMSAEETEFWLSNLRKQSLKTVTEGGEHVYAGWMDVPNWYLLTADDRANVPESQKMMVEMTRGAGGDVTVREVDSSHSTMLSKPEETASFLVEAAEACSP